MNIEGKCKFHANTKLKTLNSRFTRCSSSFAHILNVKGVARCLVFIPKTEICCM